MAGDISDPKVNPADLLDKQIDQVLLAESRAYSRPQIDLLKQLYKGSAGTLEEIYAGAQAGAHRQYGQAEQHLAKALDIAVKRNEGFQDNLVDKLGLVLMREHKFAEAEAFYEAQANRFLQIRPLHTQTFATCLIGYQKACEMQNKKPDPAVASILFQIGLDQAQRLSKQLTVRHIPGLR